MKKKLSKIIFTVLAMVSIGGSIAVTASPQTASAVDSTARQVLLQYTVTTNTSYPNGKPVTTKTVGNRVYGYVSIYARYQRTVSTVTNYFPLTIRYTDVYR
ncbi:hypothetical protein RAK27_19455 [Carnobacterium maltaromaticum]|uniref:Uncharacterized protein n=1 Tax=Carnobacterium maltaromaticum TaxID=2751 RepID=A0AAW9K8A7_CARML|nr:hypothetical protein [Carnobacterium maltaromaticum]MDZ5760825.1 hypothetical protein [Carnobacterium maltaromaticum]